MSLATNFDRDEIVADRCLNNGLTVVSWGGGPVFAPGFRAKKQEVKCEPRRLGLTLDLLFFCPENGLDFWGRKKATRTHFCFVPCPRYNCNGLCRCFGELKYVHQKTVSCCMQRITELTYTDAVSCKLKPFRRVICLHSVN